MRRQIIFRGKCSETNKWVYGDLQQDYDGSTYISTWVNTLIEPENDYWEPTLNVAKVLPDSIGQFTGIYDKNKTMIYEGDIIHNGLGLISYDESKGCFKVRWYDPTFKRVRGSSPAYDNRGELLFSNSEIAWEVIGNTFDNTELIS